MFCLRRADFSGDGVKAINASGPLIGHFDPRYQHFGRVAARLDDVANYIPARLTALAIIGVARRGYDVWMLDGDKARWQSVRTLAVPASLCGALEFDWAARPVRRRSPLMRR